MELLRSKVLAAPHGFPTREGGVSVGPYASLNASTAGGDAVEAVHENLGRLAAAAGVRLGALLTVSQVHGDRVVEARAPLALDAVTPPVAEADGLWTGEAGTAVGVKTADCLPILIEDRAGRRVAAVHAGWRGVIAEIAVRAVEALAARGARPAELRAAIGPCIQRCCFEVDGELPARFEAAFGPGVVVPVPGKQKVHLDLPLAVRRSLDRAGLPAAHVDALPHCTMCDRRFYSHRRERGLTGRHLSFIACSFATGM